MKHKFIVAVFLLLPAIALFAQETNSTTYQSPGMFSIGTRNTISMFNDDKGIGIGIGGQYRIQVTKRIGTEWFFDYITSKNGNITSRNDYHFGWSTMFYPVKNIERERFIQPYIIAGHCFDYSKVTEQANKNNAADRWSIATQAGLGTHFNFSNRLDCSLSAQYMLHFGKDIETTMDKNQVLIERKNLTTPDGHFLITLSFNYKFFHLWKANKG